MKKKMFFALVMFMSVIGAVFGQTPATLPYSCDFEAAGDNGWTLKNGTCTSQWHVGSFTSPAGHSGSLFISSDGGTTAGYDIDAAESVVVAEKLFQTGTSDSLTISFDLTIGGERNYDYLKVFWVPADTVYEVPTSWPYYSHASYSTNIIMSNADHASYRFVNLLTGTQTMSATIANEPNTLKKLVFVWKNDSRDGTQPGAIIDNIYINDCNAPTALAVSNITETSAEVSWNGTATGYEVRLNGGTPETVSTTSKTFTGLTAGTAYTVEVRAVCASSQSAWTSIEFENPTLLPYTCDFEAAGDNGWTLKNGTCTNQWHVGSFTSPAGHSGSLFISSDGGTTADYDTDAESVVVAEKLFQTGTSDSLTISFDLTIVGENLSDYLKVYWVNADTVYDATTSWTYYDDASYLTNVIMSNADNASSRFVNLLTGTQRMSATIANEPNTLKKLVFVWVNDNDSGTQPGAIIDNIYINDCDAPTALAVSNITETSAELSWNGTATGYEVRLNGGMPETVSTTSKTLTGLTARTAYTVEVRAVCTSRQSEWTSIEFYTKQIPTPLPYSCDFEASGDNGWLLNNGTCTNQWHVGSFTSPAGHSGSLFISSDGGTTAGYDIDAESVVVAEKLFQTGTSDSLTISFDLTIGGESVHDYLKVYWVNADTVYTAAAGTTPYYGSLDYTSNVIMNNTTYASSRFVNLLTGTQRMSTTIANEPNTLKKLVFVWKNDNSSGTQPGAIIDNLSVAEPCDAPTALTANNITETSAELSWNGTATGYEVRLNGGTPETVTTTSKTFTGLTAGTAYTVEVRAVCASSQSAWVSTSFTTTAVVVTPPTVETLAATEVTHEAATLNGTITAGSEEITAQGFMYKASSAADWTTVSATGTNLSATVNNLTAETAYEYKAFATTASGTVEGAVESFTTLAAPVVVTPPTVETLAATEVTHEAATLNGTITAGSEAITAQGFMYKASSATDWTTVSATGTTLTATVNNLTAETAYEYKAFATTASRTVEGEVMNFTTLAASGLADAESGAIKAMIYPNPAKDKATLSLTGLTANAKIIVSDLQGRIIQTEDLQAGTETYELNTSNYASGVYYIRILCGNNSNTQKLIIE